MRFPINPDSRGDLSLTDNGEETVFQALSQILLTYAGECPLDPVFGSAIEAYTYQGELDAWLARLGPAVAAREPRIDSLTVTLLQRTEGALTLRLKCAFIGSIVEFVRVFPIRY